MSFSITLCPEKGVIHTSALAVYRLSFLIRLRPFQNFRLRETSKTCPASPDLTEKPGSPI
jgi:hypothetical protein